MRIIVLILSIINFFLLISFSVAEAKVSLVDIPYLENGKKKLSNRTLVINPDDSQAVAIYLKGGDGLFRWTSSTTKAKRQNVDQAALDLGKKNITVLVPDWPYNMDIKGGGPMMVCGKRCSEETNMRLLNVMEFAQKNYPNKPIWIIGHSNGTTSTEYFANYLKKLNRLSELKAVILSGTRKEIRIKLPELRIFIVHSAIDGCPGTLPEIAKFVYVINQEWMKDNISLHWITGVKKDGKPQKPFGGCEGDSSHAYKYAVEEATNMFSKLILGKIN